MMGRYKVQECPEPGMYRVSVLDNGEWIAMTGYLSAGDAERVRDVLNHWRDYEAELIEHRTRTAKAERRADALEIDNLVMAMQRRTPVDESLRARLIKAEQLAEASYWQMFKSDVRAAKAERSRTAWKRRYKTAAKTARYWRLKAMDTVGVNDAETTT